MEPTWAATPREGNVTGTGSFGYRTHAPRAPSRGAGCRTSPRRSAFSGPKTLRTADFRVLRADGHGFPIQFAHVLERSGAKLAELPVL